MPISCPTAPYQRHRYPAEIIAHVVWLYFRFPLRYRDVEELLAARGINVTDETMRQWCLKVGQTDANQLRRRRSPPDDKWHWDEVFLGLNGKLHYLWPAVDQYGPGLEMLVTSRRDQPAAQRFFRKLLNGGRYVPRVMITDQCASYEAAQRTLLPGWNTANTND